MAKATPVKLKLISGRSHPELAKEIARRLKIRLTKVELEDFANGEIACRLEESVRGCDVFIIQTHSPNVHDSLMEQLLMIDAAKRASARSITAVCPFLGYARQDRKSRGREPISSRLVIDLLARAGAERIMTIDLHSGQIQGFFDGPFDHLISMPILLKQIRKLKARKLVIVSPDAGRVKLAERYGSALKCEIAIIHKHRSLTIRNHTEAKFLIGDVKGKTCVVVDDMIDTASTLGPVAEMLIENGAKAVYGVATHGLFSGPALERIKESAYKKIIVTNTLPMDPAVKPRSSKIEVVSIAPLAASAIAAVFQQKSVSAIFHGENHF